MVFIAINNEWLTRDPFREYEIKKEETTRSFLTKEEIRLLMDGKLKNAKQELYRDLYLFCAFTGLSFSDMRNLTEENIRTYFDEHEWININRQKTGVVSNIRLLDIANRIIGKYRGLFGHRGIAFRQIDREQSSLLFITFYGNKIGRAHV